MICKYCGAKIDPETEVCPKCGKRGNKREGGNGFWDIARGPASEVAPQPTHVTVEETNPLKSLIPVFICGLLCVLCIVISIIGVISSNSKIKALRTYYDGQLSEQARQNAEENYNLQRQIDQLKESVSNISFEPTHVEQSLHILSSPTPETCDIGFQSREGYYLFGLRVEGEIASFRWEKQQTNGDWITITFDENSINRELGLRLEESIVNGTSRLVAIGLTPVSFGTYKCTVVSTSGEVQSATVELINASTEEYDTADTQTTPSPFQEADEGLDDFSTSDNEEDNPNSSEEKGGWWQHG